MPHTQNQRIKKLGKENADLRARLQRAEEELKHILEIAKMLRDEHNACQRHKRERDAWFQQWPNACQSCEGWGYFTLYETHGFRHGPAEHIPDPCGECYANDPPKCPRCGSGHSEEWAEEDNSCLHCGWNPDKPDGAPPEADGTGIWYAEEQLADSESRINAFLGESHE